MSIKKLCGNCNRHISINEYCKNGALCQRHFIQPAAKKKSWKGKKRKIPSNPFYNTQEWRKLRSIFIAENPLCAACLLKNSYTPAAHVDHIMPVRHYDSLKLEPSNLQALCHSCHSIKTGFERRGIAIDFINRKKRKI